jgi:two-component system sensor histidine kinase KdpD
MSGFRHLPRGIHLEVIWSGEDVIDADAEWVNRVLVHLLFNAIHYSPNGGLVVLHAEIYDGKLAFTVSDQGPGVAEDRHETIFGSGAHGTARGLGLASCRRLAREHAATLDLVPSVGGAIFAVVLPTQSH